MKTKEIDIFIERMDKPPAHDDNDGKTRNGWVWWKTSDAGALLLMPLMLHNRTRPEKPSKLRAILHWFLYCFFFCVDVVVRFFSGQNGRRTKRDHKPALNSLFSIKPYRITASILRLTAYANHRLNGSVFESCVQITTHRHASNANWIRSGFIYATRQRQVAFRWEPMCK